LMSSLEAKADQLFLAVNGYVSRAIGAFSARLKALEDRPLPAPEKGERGEKGDPGDAVIGQPGTSAYEIAVQRGFNGDVDAWLLSLRGPAGDAGRDVDQQEVVRAVTEAVAKAIEALPEPKAGVDGKSVTIEDVAPLIQGLVKDAVGAIKVRDGLDGKDADPELIRQEVAKAVDAIPRPKDGVDGKSVTVDDVRPVLMSMQSEWALDFEKRAHDLLQRSIDRIPLPKDGVNGKDGRDALDLDDLDVTTDGEGCVTVRFSRGEVVKEFQLQFPCFIDRGVFKPDTQYRTGNGVTYGGNWWMAQKDAPAGKPGETPDWRMCVRKGRDGKDGEKGDRGEKGMDGRNGRDLTSFGMMP